VRKLAGEDELLKAAVTKRGDSFRGTTTPLSPAASVVEAARFLKMAPPF
jgi:hypothetical protein